MDVPRMPGSTDGEAATGHSHQHWQRGQTLVMVALMMVALIAFLGLVIDGGNVFAQRRQMQNAADAAALAGARAQALQGLTATVGAAQTYAAANGATSCSVVTTTSTVTARAEEEVQTFLVRVIGVDTVPVGASATAEITTPTTLGCGFLPLTIPYQDPDSWPEGEFFIWQRCDSSKQDDCQSTIDIQESANGWLNLDGDTDWSVDAKELQCWICPDLSGCGSVGNPGVDLGWTNGSPGLTGALKQVEQCAKGTTVYIPLYGAACCDQPSAEIDACSAHPEYHPDDAGNGQCHYDIVAFAPFHITDVKETTDTRAIKGYYDPDYVGDDCVIVGSGGGKPAGLYVIRLIK